MLEGEIEEYAELRAKIHDWGLSHPTLEEVFLKLTNKFDNQGELEKMRREFEYAN